MANVVSLFTGCGGSDLGVIENNHNIIFANDILPYARDVYLANHPHTDYQLKNISEINNFPEAELLVGCYPCQGFSQGGVRDPSRKINTLYYEFARALKQVKPRAFVVENVNGMLRSNYKHLLDDQIKVFTERGYTVKAQVLLASDYGVAQDRKRIFIVGIRNDLSPIYKYEFPKPTHGEGCEYSKVTIKEALKWMRKWPTSGYYDREFHWYYMSRNRRCEWNGQAKTIVANPRHMPLHPCSPKMIKHAHNDWRFESDQPARRFTYKEAARLQGFDNLDFPENEYSSLEMKYTVVGNAVPPQMFKNVVSQLSSLLS